MQIIKEKIETDVYKYICDTCKQSYISQRYIQKCEICGKDICNNCGPNYKLKTFTVKTKKDNYCATKFNNKTGIDKCKSKSVYKFMAEYLK